MTISKAACRPLADMRILLIGVVASFLIPNAGAVFADDVVFTGSVTVSNFSAPAEYCVLGWETSADASKWTQRHILEIPDRHHFLRGDIFVSYTLPDLSNSWFSSGEAPSITGFKPASWYSYAEHGPIAYYSGVLNPVIPVNVVSKPLNISSLEGGWITISYGIRENANSTIADSYQDSKGRGGIIRQVVTFPPSTDTRGFYTRYCFIVTGVKKEVACEPNCF